MKKISKLCIAISCATITSGCGPLTSVFMTANYLKDHYCELPEPVRDKVLIKIRKEFPEYPGICSIPDIIPSA